MAQVDYFGMHYSRNYVPFLFIFHLLRYIYAIFYYLDVRDVVYVTTSATTYVDSLVATWNWVVITYLGSDYLIWNGFEPRQKILQLR